MLWNSLSQLLNLKWLNTVPIKWSCPLITGAVVDTSCLFSGIWTAAVSGKDAVLLCSVFRSSCTPSRLVSVPVLPSWLHYIVIVYTEESVLINLKPELELWCYVFLLKWKLVLSALHNLILSQLLKNGCCSLNSSELTCIMTDSLVSPSTHTWWSSSCWVTWMLTAGVRLRSELES